MAEQSSTDKTLADWFGRMESRIGSSAGSGGAAGGEGLVAHELAHVAQQGSGRAAQQESCETADGVQHSITEKDWSEKKADFVGAIQGWCDGMRHIVNQFEKDLSQKDADSSEITLALAVAKSVIGEMVPANYKLAQAVTEHAVTYVLAKVKAAQAGRVALRDFCRAWDSGFDDFKKASAAHGKMYTAFRGLLEKKCGDGLTYEKIVDEISYLEKQLPDRNAVRKSLLKAWIDSTEDESAWFGDVLDDAGGYFHVRIQRQGPDRWKLIKAYLDDTDEQAGVVKVLQMEYSGKKLESLPFPMKVFLTHGINNDLTIGEKGKSGGLRFKKGNADVWDDWMRSGGHPTTKDLSKDSIL